MKAAGAESSTGASKAKVNTPERSYNTEKYKLLLITVATSWSASVLMCVFHLALCIRLINKRCESSVIQFNARCAGYLLIFGCCKSLCATLVGPLRVIHGILHRDVTVFRKGANPLALFVVFGWFILSFCKDDIGTVASGIALLLMPLRGFYVCLGALACKKYSRAEYVSTVATSCMDSFITCAIFWSLVRGRDMDLLDKNNKLNRKALQSNKPQHGFV